MEHKLRLRNHEERALKYSQEFLFHIYQIDYYYLRNKKVSTRLHVYLRLESMNHQKIGEIIKALQICKQSTQTASL